MMFWFFLTPILYAPQMLPEEWQDLWLLNPVAGLMNDLRAAMLEGAVLPGRSTWIMLAAGGTMFVVGRSFFRRLAPYFEDYL